jgi:hypothetical protein
MSEGSIAPEGKVRFYDGVAVVRRGDAVLICYQKAARLARTRWLFDVIDAFARAAPEGLLTLLIVLEGSEPPDGPTREENAKRLKALGPAVRRLVTVPVGDAFKTAIVRALMRALNLALGHSKHRVVSDTIEDGLTQLLEGASPRTPKRQQLKLDIEALYDALGGPEGSLESARPRVVGG